MSELQQPFDPSTPQAGAFEIRECLRPECGLRFPASSADPHRLRCPKCRAETRRVETYPPTDPGADSEPGVQPARRQIEVLVDNVRSKLNVGAIFRISDGAGVSHLHLGGITPTPDSDPLGKTALGAERNVPWSAYPNGVEAAQTLLRRGFHLWGLETGATSRPLFSTDLPPADAPFALVIGSEVAGIDPAIRRLCECLVSLPMGGQKESLNVAVAYGIAIYTIAFRG